MSTLGGKAIAALGLLAVATVATAVGRGATRGAPLAAQDPYFARIEEAWVSHETDVPDDLDSPAYWRGGGEHGWVIVTAKKQNALFVLDAGTGEVVERIAGPDSERFGRPNGIAVWRDVLIVVERDNRRVSLARLPDFEPIASFGTGELINPYGITVIDRAHGRADVYVTDEYGSAAHASEYPVRVHQNIKLFRLLLEDGELDVELVEMFGGVGSATRLNRVESVLADPTNERLLVADEAAVDIKVFTLTGEATGRVIGTEYLRFEPEGMAVLDCAEGSYVILTDQNEHETAFHLLEGETLRWLGGFKGHTTAETDGIAVTDLPVGGMNGALFAVHADQAVTAFSIDSILRAFDLPTCAPAMNGHGEPR